MRSIDFLSPGFRDDPWPTYAHYREHAPVWWSDSIRMFCVFGYADIRRCLTDPAFSVKYPFRVSRQVLGETLLDMEGPDHRRLRKLLAQALLGRTENAGFTDAVQRVVSDVFEDFAGEETVEFLDRVATRVPLLTTAAFLGIPRSDCALVSERLRYLLGHLDGSQGNFAKASATRAALSDYVSALLAESPPPPPDSMIGQARVWVEQGTLNVAEAVGLVLLTLAAGVETSTGLLSNGMVCFSRFPEWRDRVVADPSLMPRVIREVLRWEPPQHDTVRFAVSDCELGGVDIPRGSALKLLLASGNRDAMVFSNPDEFDPMRPETSHLAFGHGIHSCLGMHLASRVAEIFFNMQFARFAGARVDEDPIPAITGSTFRHPITLKVRLLSSTVG